MNQKYRVVPWSSSDEWRDVYEHIFVSSTDESDGSLATALDVIRSWEKRVSNLPRGVEGTLCILEAMLLDENLPMKEYQMLYSAHIMRFMNICVAGRSEVNSFSKTAKDSGIPDWIVDIRHDFAHSQTLPSMSKLQLALPECLNWLLNNYWLSELSKIEDTTIVSRVDNCKLSTSELFGLYCKLLNYAAWKLPHDSHIIEQLKLIDTNYKKLTTIQIVFNLIMGRAPNMSGKDWQEALEVIFSSGLFTIAPMALCASKGISDDLYQSASEMIFLIARSNKLGQFLMNLIDMTQIDSLTDNEHMAGAAWLGEIFQNINELSMKSHWMKQLLAIKPYLLQNATTDIHQKLYISSYFKTISLGSDVNQILKIVDRKVRDTGPNIDDSSQIEQIEQEFNNKLLQYIGDDSSPIVKEECKSAWTLVQDTTAFEPCALGILPIDYIL